MKLRAVAGPAVRGLRMEAHALRAQIMREHVAELIVFDLAKISGPAAERRDPRRGVAGRATGNLDRRPHVAIELLGGLLIDEPHHALRQTMFGEERILDPREHIDNGIADA